MTEVKLSPGTRLTSVDDEGIEIVVGEIDTNHNQRLYCLSQKIIYTLMRFESTSKQGEVDVLRLVKLKPRQGESLGIFKVIEK